MEKDFVLEYKGRLYNIKDLQKIIDRNAKMILQAGKDSCPLCECSLSENEMFVCTECEELKHDDEKCTCHYDFFDDVCKECCELCRIEQAEWDEADRQYDRMKEEENE